uniref:Uncharacterized protein n=1 Tax=viral metagenome TaxID=1070528 RepID=A0A6C0KSW8_9ZZZZ
MPTQKKHHTFTKKRGGGTAEIRDAQLAPLPTIKQSVDAYSTITPSINPATVWNNELQHLGGKGTRRRGPGRPKKGGNGNGGSPVNDTNYAGLSTLIKPGYEMIGPADHIAGGAHTKKTKRKTKKPAATKK